ncbi:unnamed protein product [Kluyveromyces dobzhanskii CBS 2104]|uniref:Mediator of RNA polymerase II transcription subunit 13 n=1 Tax=Kluyveromyces dobzhanskii CBS 2104 TaxID=1427455 RepID=A0A0A8L1F1_9SACH|nr:unnamed protein product [Kluyveromyces dobzhanskii CBS 2104]
MKDKVGDACRLEDIITNLYRLETVQKINYHQYIPGKTDNQWSIQAELFLRRKNPKVFAALFSRELWCFSINDDPLPELNFEQNSEQEVPQPERKGHFTPEFSKPHLPTPYAIFMKALRRMIYVNLTLSSNETIVPFGNSCIFQEPSTSATKILHFDPHLFENGDLTVAICLKDLRLFKLKAETLTPEVAVYLAPSGIRVYLPSTDLNKCYVPPPQNSQMFLKTLCISHGIDLRNLEDLKWVKLIPNANHLNGFTPTISQYLDEPNGNNYVIWPACLCYVQTAIDVKKPQQNGSPRSAQLELDDCFDMIDGFIQLKLTSAYRTPGTSAGIGTVTGHNPLSTGGVFTDQFQGFSKHSVNTGNNVPSTGDNGKSSPEYSNDPNMTPLRDNKTHRQNFPAEPYGSTGFITTPIINENITPTVDDIITETPSVKPQNDLWNDKKDAGNNEPNNNTKSLSVNSSEAKTGFETGFESSAQNPSSGNPEDVDFDKELFGEDSDEDVNSKNNIDEMASVKEITDEMFDLAEDDDDVDGLTNDSSKSENAGSNEFPGANERKTRVKRTYLDIPVDVITIEKTPSLYEDPGAPLPIETPKDRKKSIFAPLNFNPIFESNVDNKYKNGGKFSVNSNFNEEPVQFGISTSNVSSSEDEDSDFSPSDFNNNGVFAGKGLIYDPRENDMPIIEPATYEPMPKDTLPELINPPSASKDDCAASSYNLMGSLMEKPIKTNVEAIWKPGSNKSEKAELVTNQKVGGNGPYTSSASNPNNTTYFENTPSLGPETLYDNSKPANILSAIEPELKSEQGTQTAEQGQSESSRILPYLLRHMPLFSLPDAFLCKNPSLPPGKDLEDILDILTDQIVFNNDMFSDEGVKDSYFKGIKDYSVGIVSDTMKLLFGSFSKLHGNEIIDDIFYLPEPSVFVKKAEDTIKIKSSSCYFSEYLNLKPNRGVKNFRALALTTEAKNDCMSFISQMSQTYSNHELGFCELTKLTNEDNKGLIYLKNFNQDTLLLLSAQIVSFCSTALSNIKNIPLLILLPINRLSLADCISMILKFHVIRKEVKSKLPKAEVLLRLVDIDFLKNPLTSTNAYTSLCVAIYNSLPPNSTKVTSLTNDLPKQIEFRTLKNTSLSIYYDNYIHLAYLRSIDREWLCAAWSDTKGVESFVKTWYVGNSRTRFEQVCNEIWKITLQLASKNFGNVCLVLTRLDSVLPDDELIHWRRLSVATKDLHLAVVCVGDNTKLSLFDEDKTYPTFKPFFRSKQNVQGKGTDNIDDFEIINIDEEVHGIIFSNPLQLANSQHRCAIKSGALIRFAKSEGDNFIDKFEVNLLNCPHADSSTLLKEILKQYRNLAGLNAWFGVSYGSDNYMPWHVVAVKHVMNSIVHVKGSFEKETYVID